MKAFTKYIDVVVQVHNSEKSIIWRPHQQFGYVDDCYKHFKELLNKWYVKSAEKLHWILEWEKENTYSLLRIPKIEIPIIWWFAFKICLKWIETHSSQNVIDGNIPCGFNTFPMTLVFYARTTVFILLQSFASVQVLPLLRLFIYSFS